MSESDTDKPNFLAELLMNLTTEVCWMRVKRFVAGGADSSRRGADSSRAFASVCDVRLALAISDGVE